jgi:hypothetical protein
VNLNYLFRRPKFPIICNIDGDVLAAKSEKKFLKFISTYSFSIDSFYPVIDVSGEGWTFNPNHLVISPITMKKKWTKKEIISMFNDRKNNSSNLIYSFKSISAKRFEKIFREIVELLITNP